MRGPARKTLSPRESMLFCTPGVGMQVSRVVPCAPAPASPGTRVAFIDPHVSPAVTDLRKAKGQSDPTTPAGSQHSCQPTAKLHILPLVWNFPLG